MRPLLAAVLAAVVSTTAASATAVSLTAAPPTAAPPNSGQATAAVERSAPPSDAPPPAAAPADLARFSGLYHGAIVYRAGEMELESVVELGLDGEGRLTGTIDQPGFFEYQPLEGVTLEGDTLRFGYRRFSEVRGPDAPFDFEATLVDGGAALEGGFLESRGRIPFRLERIGDPGTPRPQMGRRPLADLAPSGDELRDAFNADADSARLVLLLSPKCPVCLSSSRLIGRYLTAPVDDERLALYVVWGPMLGGETRADAEAATAFLDDPRARHFWTDAHDVTALFHAGTGLPADELAWDTFHLYAPGARWGEAPPEAAAVWHVNKPLPEESYLNGPELRERVEAMLAADGAAAAR